MQQAGLICASFYLAFVVSGQKLDCLARRVVCTGPYRAILKVVKKHISFWLLLRWAMVFWLEGSAWKLQIFPALRCINKHLRCKNLSQKWSYGSHFSQQTRWLSSCESLYQCPWSLLATASLVVLAPLLSLFVLGFTAFQQNTEVFWSISSGRWKACCPLSSAAPCSFHEANEETFIQCIFLLINLLKLDLNWADLWVFWRLNIWCKWQKWQTSLAGKQIRDLFFLVAHACFFCGVPTAFEVVKFLFFHPL